MPVDHFLFKSKRERADADSHLLYFLVHGRKESLLQRPSRTGSAVFRVRVRHFSEETGTLIVRYYPWMAASDPVCCKWQSDVWDSFFFSGRVFVELRMRPERKAGTDRQAWRQQGTLGTPLFPGHIRHYLLGSSDDCDVIVRVWVFYCDLPSWLASSVGIRDGLFGG